METQTGSTAKNICVKTKKTNTAKQKLPWTGGGAPAVTPGTGGAEGGPVATPGGGGGRRVLGVTVAAATKGGETAASEGIGGRELTAAGRAAVTQTRETWLIGLSDAHTDVWERK